MPDDSVTVANDTDGRRPTLTGATPNEVLRRVQGPPHISGEILDGAAVVPAIETSGRSRSPTVWTRSTSKPQADHPPQTRTDRGPPHHPVRRPTPGIHLRRDQAPPPDPAPPPARHHHPSRPIPESPRSRQRPHRIPAETRRQDSAELWSSVAVWTPSPCCRIFAIRPSSPHRDSRVDTQYQGQKHVSLLDPKPRSTRTTHRQQASLA